MGIGRVKEAPRRDVFVRNETFKLNTYSPCHNKTTTSTNWSNMSHQVEPKVIQDRGDKRNGGFGLKEKNDIRGIGYNQCLETSNCSWTSNPSAVSRKNLLMLLRDTTWSPKLIESSFTNTAEVTMNAEAKVFFLFLEALK
jgi:hypothetical protein